LFSAACRAGINGEKMCERRDAGARRRAARILIYTQERERDRRTTSGALCIYGVCVQMMQHAPLSVRRISREVKKVVLPTATC
jgi:hypothetical protein